VEKIRDVRRGRAVSTQKLRLLVESRQSKLQPVFHQLFVTDEWRIDQQGHVAVVSGLALLLSLMAIYAVMVFTVVQRTGRSARAWHLAPIAGGSSRLSCGGRSCRSAWESARAVRWSLDAR